jgi:ribonuclease BN (tRNA processing enzyme)
VGSLIVIDLSAGVIHRPFSRALAPRARRTGPVTCAAAVHIPFLLGQAPKLRRIVVQSDVDRLVALPLPIFPGETSGKIPPGRGAMREKEPGVAVRFTVLGSGSTGNASLLQVDDLGILIDAGLGPRQIASRLKEVGAGWHSVGAAVLTHTHADHWREPTLAKLCALEIPLYCHATHVRQLAARSVALQQLRCAGLVRTYRENACCALNDVFWFRPLPISHDGGPTFGFRMQRDQDLFHRRWSMAYLADLGMWNGSLVECLGDVDMLALEFNHDVGLQQCSGRSPYLIARVLGDQGHLSNEQAAELLTEIARQGYAARLTHLVQLHLSQQCNRPSLARLAAQQGLHTSRRAPGTPGAPAIHTAGPHQPLSIAVQAF